MGAGQPRLRSIAATGSCWRNFAVRTSDGMSLPIIWAITGRPVVFFTMSSTIHFSGVEVEWTRRYSVQ
jgi:hypothetical protein